MFVVVIFHLFYVLVKNLCCICGGTKREVIRVKYGRELTNTHYMHPLQHLLLTGIFPMTEWINTSVSVSVFCWISCLTRQLPDASVAERISYFSLARNLIRPFGSTHIFTQSGWLILFIPDHLSGQHQIGESRQTLFLILRISSFNSSSSSSSSSITPPPGKPSNLLTPCVYSLRPSVPSWIWIR